MEINSSDIREKAQLRFTNSTLRDFETDSINSFEALMY